jgi:protein SCO1/2
MHQMPQPIAGKRIFPNVPVDTHEGRRVLFYDDLIRDKIVIVNFMSISHDAVYPVARNLAEVQRFLGRRLGRDVFLYSVTVDRERDTVGALRAFASASGARPGWLFVTGPDESLSALKQTFFSQGADPTPHAVAAAAGQGQGHGHGAASHQGQGHDCALGLLRYGNDAVGLWGSVPAKAEPARIAERLSWIEARPPRDLTAGLRRGGPFHAAVEPNRTADARSR